MTGSIPIAAKQSGKKSVARPGPRAEKAVGESAVLANLAETPQPDRALGERLHVIIKANASALSPRLWYGMPAYAKGGKVVLACSKARTSSKQGTRRLASCTRRTSTMARCGRPPSQRKL